MKVANLRSAYERVGNIVYFGRMLDRISLYQARNLPPEYHEMYGGGFDERTCDFLQVNFAAISEQVAHGAADEEVLQWSFKVGRRPSEDEIEIWNAFMEKRGWRDPLRKMLIEELAAKGWEHRSDIETLFDFFDADEGRPLRLWIT